MIICTLGAPGAPEDERHHQWRVFVAAGLSLAFLVCVVACEYVPCDHLRIIGCLLRDDEIAKLLKRKVGRSGKRKS